MTNLNESRTVMQCFDIARDEKGLIALSLALMDHHGKLKSGILEILRSLIYRQFEIILCIAGASTSSTF
jgi:hypothetical protein